MKEIKKQQELNKLILELDEFPKQFIDSAARILSAGNQLGYALDFFANAVNNRAIALTKGFVTLVKEENYLCAIPLIRIQLDNGLRFFASSLVENPNDFFSHYASGKAIRDFKDSAGKKLTDSYLAKKLDSHFPGVLKLYKDTSGHIHLSENHLFATTKTDSSPNDRKISVRIGSYDIFSLDSKIDFVRTMLEVGKLVIIVLEEWRTEKEKLSKELIQNNIATLRIKRN